MGEKIMNLIFTAKQDDYDKIILNENISIIGYMAELEEGRKLISKGGNTFDITAQGWNALK